jgi:hypothetical protein
MLTPSLRKRKKGFRSTQYMYHLLKQSIILRFARKVYLSVSNDSQSKQELFP